MLSMRDQIHLIFITGPLAMKMLGRAELNSNKPSEQPKLVKLNQFHTFKLANLLASLIF